MERFTSVTNSTATPISIQDWVQLASGTLPSKKTCVHSAVDLAWVLTNHLCQNLDTLLKGNLHSHITAENLRIFIDRSSLTPCSDLKQDQLVPSSISIQDVKFQYELSGLSSLLSVVARADTGSNTSPSSSTRKVCVALGKLLLYIFSGGQTIDDDDTQDNFKLDGQLKQSENGSGTSWAQTQNGDSYDNDTSLAPAGKRQTTGAGPTPTSNSTSSMANSILLQSGMPLSICQLVCDLLAAKNEKTINPSQSQDSLEELLLLGATAEEEQQQQNPSLAIVSLEEALWDLTQMKQNPECFLFDRTCPKKALDDTGLFGIGNGGHLLFGRENELDTLTTAKNKIFNHVVHSKDMEGKPSTSSQSTSAQSYNFLCETIFMGGYAGSGKSSIVHSLVRACNEEEWFVLNCKFDKQAAPHMIISKSFDEFFGRWNGSGIGSGSGSGTNEQSDSSLLKNAFRKVCRHIFASIDDGCFQQLCVLVPNFAKIFPLFSFARGGNNQQQDKSDISSMDKVGSAKNRLRTLFRLLFNSLCSAGVPVIFTLDDLQWVDSSVMEIVTDFVVHLSYDSSPSDKIPGCSFRRGLLIVGTYRSNEVIDEDDLLKSINCMKQSERANVTMLTVGELTEEDISKLISAKLCLPRRYVHELSQLLHRKTRGNSFFVVQFLLSIIQSKLLEFSVRSRRWNWEYDAVDYQTISQGVAELLIARFSQLPRTLMQTLKIVSCLGYQVELSTIEAMNSRHEVLSFDMVGELQAAVKEGIMEKAGPVYQFAHDIIQQTAYELIPLSNRNLLHKVIGKAILNTQVQVVDNNSTIHLMAMDQINKYYSGRSDNDSAATCNPEERSQFAASNAIAAKSAMAASSFEQVRVYVNYGIQMLDANHWEKQYSLSLRLFEMSASVSCMHGDIATMSSCLDAILSHARNFYDTLKASSLLVKLLASSSKFEQARDNCIAILSNLGEVFSRNASLPIVLNELSVMQTTLTGITIDHIKQLPPLTDKSKLNAMKFLNMLCMYSIISKPMLIPLASCRMITITMQYGFCDDSIVGLATAAYSLYLFTEEIQLASHLGKVSEALVEDSPKKHALRSRLSNELYATLKANTQPTQSVIALIPEIYNSAMLSGDVENALMCRWNYCGGCIMTGAMNLESLSKNLAMLINEAKKYRQETVLYSTMSYMNTCLCLAGTSNDEVGLKTHDELGAIAEKTNNYFCALANIFCCSYGYFFMRNYMAVVELSKKHSAQRVSSQQKRLQVVFRTFYEGIAAFSLARDTRQQWWKAMGEKAVIVMAKAEMISKWNYENKSKLLQAELYYLDGNLEAAEVEYKCSIKSAQEHKFINEEALACELYGMFFIENGMANSGSVQLNLALDKYKQWGAMGKANELQQFIDLVTSVKA